MIGITKQLTRLVSQRYGFYPYKSSKQKDLLMLDNLYPNPISGFRYEEFTFLLCKFKNSKIILNPTSYKHLKTPKNTHKEHIRDLKHNEPDVNGKLIVSKCFVNVNTKLFYCIFLNTILVHLPWLERLKIPFVFTLYPGGGLQLNNAMKDNLLKKVFNSPMFKKVIVNQLITKNYLIESKLCKESAIEYVFGCVVPQNSINKDLSKKLRYLKDKNTFDICFCAAKYMEKGIDKGYDVFIEAAHILSTRYDSIRFHVVGGFNKSDLCVQEIGDKIIFYGYQEFESLIKIYESMDVFVSPNKPFVLNTGSFDGFPLGTAVEAALNGVVVLATDYFEQNTHFTPNEELVIIESHATSVVNEVSNLIDNPEKLFSISERGKEKFSRIYSNDVQMNTRFEVLNNTINKI